MPRFFPAILSSILAFTLILPQGVFAQSGFTPSVVEGLNLPQLGVMIPLSTPYQPAIVKGITIYPDNPLKFDFIVDPGDDRLKGDALKTEADKLIKYFMASLTVPADEMWVNLSPYEKDRIIAHGLSQTELGRDLLAQDYILKQVTASLIYPEEKLGNDFWERVYAKVQDQYGTTEIAMDTFNKVWIVPQRANVYVHGNNVFVVDNYLKVMLEEDYLALETNLGHARHGVGTIPEDQITKIRDVLKQVIREILIPEIEREVNEGKNFANLRQIFNSMILATWYKKNLKESLLGQVYANKNKIAGIDLEDKNIKEKIYNQYVQAFEKGVFDFIKENYDESTQKAIPRRYFSGGIAVDNLDVKQKENWERGQNGIAFPYTVVLQGISGGGNSAVHGNNSLINYIAPVLDQSMLANDPVSVIIIDSGQGGRMVADKIMRFARRKYGDGAKNVNVSPFLYGNPVGGLEDEEIQTIIWDLVEKGVNEVIMPMVNDAIPSNGKKQGGNKPHVIWCVACNTFTGLGAEQIIRKALAGRGEDMSAVLENMQIVTPIQLAVQRVVEKLHQLNATSESTKPLVYLMATDASIRLRNRGSYFNAVTEAGFNVVFDEKDIGSHGAQAVEVLFSAQQKLVNAIEKSDSVAIDRELSSIVNQLEHMIPHRDQNLILILGCTHYKYIKDKIQKMLVERGIYNVDVIDSNEVVTDQVIGPESEKAAHDSNLTSEKKHQFNRGGIDLNSEMLNLNSRAHGIDFDVKGNFQGLKNMIIDGFAPVIINVAPMIDINMLLGLKEKSDDIKLGKEYAGAL